MIFLKNSNMVHIKKKIPLQTSISFPQHISSSWWVNSSLVVFTQLFFLTECFVSLALQTWEYANICKTRNTTINVHHWQVLLQHTKITQRTLFAVTNETVKLIFFLDKSEEWDGSDSFLKSNNTKFPSSLSFFLCLSH